MYKEHPVFKPPADENAKIWRYIDFTKFVSLIDKQALFFAQVDSLDDKFEGSLAKHIIEPSLEDKATDEEQKKLEKLRERHAEFTKSFRKRTFVNCWHMNEYESAAMWKLYLKSEEGVAIQSTYRRLADSFNKDDIVEVFIGTINYIDYEKERIPIQNALYPFLYKRKSFEHEKELRVIILDTPTFQPISTTSGTFYIERYCDLPHSLLIPATLDKLIENVYVSPTAQNWFKDLGKSVLKKYGFDKPVIKSSLADEPMFEPN